ncbi:YcaO-like family protein [Rhizobium sp. YIM 134829]|uniref:YcaO-like family protein n=1 Tax=Rhizobium sp. YIM 134829 TaxID=3390453 RepID=UPI00397C772E
MTGDPYRSRDPAETVSMMTPHLAALGITRVGCQTGLDRLGIPVWFAVTPNARAIAIAQGKGVTDDDARASAVMEAVERAIASAPSCPRHTLSKTQIAAAGGRPDDLDMLLSPNASAPSPDEALEWVVADHLLDGKPVHLPFDAVHLDRTLPDPRYWRSSDGLASGNSWNEAVLHGLLERVERDALTLWQVTPATRRTAALDPALLRSDMIDSLIARIESAGLVLRLFDITSDLGLPCFMALIAPRAVLKGGPVRHVQLTLGSGAHLAAEAAALRAITEAAQSRLTFIGGARDDVPAAMFTQPAPEDLCQILRRPIEAREPAVFDSAPKVAAERLPFVLDRVRRAGIRDVYTVRLDDGRLPVAVVKVIVPALENPPGARRQTFGSRALRQVLS